MLNPELTPEQRAHVERVRAEIHDYDPQAEHQAIERGELVGYFLAGVVFAFVIIGLALVW